MSGPRIDNLQPLDIAVFRALFLGDLLCAVPALRSLRQRFPNARITLIGLPWAEAFVERTPYLDRLLPFGGYPGLPEVPVQDGQVELFLARAREARFDLALQLHGTGEFVNDIMSLIDARFSVGYGPDNDDRLSLALRWRDDEHEVERWLHVAATLGADTTDRRLEFAVTSEDARAASRLLSALTPGAGPVVGLHPGAKEEARRWPVECFARLGDELVRQCGARIVVTGNQAEQDLSRAIAAQMDTSPLQLTGQTDLGAFAGLIQRLDLLVTNDTGASHLAAALRTPSVVLFGPTRPQRWAPLDRSLHTVIDATEHSPPRISPAHALRNLPVSTVLKAAKAALARARNRRAAALESEVCISRQSEVVVWNG